MKKILLACGIAAVAFATTACSGSSNATPKTFPDSIAYYTGQEMGLYCLNTIDRMPEDVQKKFDKDQFLKGMAAVIECDTTKMGYLEGIQMGLNMMNNVKMLTEHGMPINPETIMAQVRAIMSHDSISEAESDSIHKIAGGITSRVNGYLMKVQHERQAAELQAREELARKNAEAGKAYLDKVKSEDKNVKETESGLLYKVEKEGDGVKPQDGDRVKVKYTGRLVDGTEFDSSKGETREFPVNGVVPGFKEGLKLMSKGAKYTLMMPGEIAYGFQAPANIGPNSTLIFDVELVEIIPGKK